MALPSFSLQLKVSLPAFALGLLVFFVSFSVSFWASGSYKDVDFHGGLWRVCVSKDNFQSCGTWSDDVAKYLAKGKILNTTSPELRAESVCVCVGGGGGGGEALRVIPVLAELQVSDVLRMLQVSSV